MSILGIFVVPFLPISLEYGAELTFPMGTAFVGGILYGSSQVFACIVLLIVQPLIEFQVDLFFLFMFILVSANFITSLFIKEDLRRHRHESSGFSEKMMKELA